jgi:gluconolactonase
MTPSSGAGASGSFRTSEFTVVCEGLGYPEGPTALADGSVLLVELAAGTLTKITPAGQREVVATLGGSPNGAAIGPDGQVYVCNSGGFTFLYVGKTGISPVPSPGAIALTADRSPAYVGGSIQRVDPRTGEAVTLYREFSGMLGDGMHTLCGPDDLVFDTDGGFWFTDWGHSRGRLRDITGVYYARADGSLIREAIFPLNAPNGIALSPDGRRLYVAETYTRRVLAWDLAGPGQIAKTGDAIDYSHLVTSKIPFEGILDSMALDESGNIYVATMLPHGPTIGQNGGITVVSPEGEVLEFIEIAAGAVQEPLPSNICFGGADRRTAFVTLGGTGRLVSCRMRVPGLPRAFEPAAV